MRLDFIFYQPEKTDNALHMNQTKPKRKRNERGGIKKRKVRFFFALVFYSLVGDVWVSFSYCLSTATFYLSQPINQFWSFFYIIISLSVSISGKGKTFCKPRFFCASIDLLRTILKKIPKLCKMKNLGAKNDR